MMSLSDVRSSLQIDYDSKKESFELKRKKLYNINSFNRIDRANLDNGTHERMLLLHITENNEYVCIQYPGKESRNNNPRPYDFKPVIAFADGTISNDLKFEDVWNGFLDIFDIDKESLILLSTLFCRMAYMIDHDWIDETFDCIDISQNNTFAADPVRLSFYKYNVHKSENKKAIDYLQKKIGNIHGMSIEAYLMYLDILAQNEDCKYNYGQTGLVEKLAGLDIGRINNLTTSVNIISMITRRKTIGKVLNDLSRGGVAPPNKHELPHLTDGLFNWTD